MLITLLAGTRGRSALSHHRRNLVEEVNASYMKTCLYHKTLHPLCPVFNLGYVVQQSGQDFRRLAEKVQRGARH